MTFLVFCGVLVSLLILRSIPGLMLRLFLAIPKHRFIEALRTGRRIAIVLPRRNTSVGDTALVTASGRLRLVLVSSSLLMLALLATTAFWSHHTASLMILLR